MAKLHLVFGGKVADPRSIEFTDIDKLDIVGIYPDYQEAEGGPGAPPLSVQWTMPRCAMWWSICTGLLEPGDPANP